MAIRSLSGDEGRAARRGSVVGRQGATRKAMFGIVDESQRGLDLQSPAPGGLRRRDAICVVAAPRRWRHIVIVAAPCI